jgi:hypothetical protein
MFQCNNYWRQDATSVHLLLIFFNKITFIYSIFLILIADFCHDIPTRRDVQNQGTASVHFTKSYTKVEFEFQVTVHRDKFLL